VRLSRTLTRLSQQRGELVLGLALTVFVDVARLPLEA